MLIFMMFVVIPMIGMLASYNYVFLLLAVIPSYVFCRYLLELDSNIITNNPIMMFNCWINPIAIIVNLSFCLNKFNYFLLILSVICYTGIIQITIKYYVYKNKKLKEVAI